jgi:hypothetical protein
MINMVMISWKSCDPKTVRFERAPAIEAATNCTFAQYLLDAFRLIHSDGYISILNILPTPLSSEPVESVHFQVFIQSMVPLWSAWHRVLSLPLHSRQIGVRQPLGSSRPSF